MTTGEKKTVAHYLLIHMTNILLAESPRKDSMQKASDAHRMKLAAHFSTEEFAPIKLMAKAAGELAKKLAACTSVEMLDHSFAYMMALNAGEVMVAQEDPETGSIVGYQPNS